MSFDDREEIASRFAADGFAVLPGLLPGDLLADLRAALPSVLAEPGPQRFYEADGDTVRAVYGLQRKNGPWRRVSRQSVVPEIAAALLGTDVYVYQWKVNPKAARTGEHWEWHRDFPFWHWLDGMPAAEALTAAVFLEEVSLDNGPLRMIPGSHVTPSLPGEITAPDLDPARVGDDDWAATVSANLAFSVPEASALAVAHPVDVIGPAGTVAFFRSDLVHGSVPNRSTMPRPLGLITYNAVRNAPPPGWPNVRPDFFYSRDAVPTSLG